MRIKPIIRFENMVDSGTQLNLETSIKGHMSREGGMQVQRVENERSLYVLHTGRDHAGYENSKRRSNVEATARPKIRARSQPL